MISEETLNKPIMMMTGREFLELFKIVKEEKAESKTYNSEDYAKGIPGLMELLKCGRSKAQQIKSSGVIDEAIIQDGRYIFIEKKKALELLKEKSLLA